jgi:hypothetical protein
MIKAVCKSMLYIISSLSSAPRKNKRGNFAEFMVYCERDGFLFNME